MLKKQNSVIPFLTRNLEKLRLSRRKKKLSKKCDICNTKDTYLNYDKCIFHCDKTDTDNIKWNNLENDNVKYFWQAIRKQIANELASTKDEHNFVKYIFPIFEKHSATIRLDKNDSKSPYCAKEENNFWGKDANGTVILKFNFWTNFSEANFSEANFQGVTFFRWAWFSSVIFSEGADFSGATFCDTAMFDKGTIFGDKSSFFETTFYGRAFFRNVTFGNDTEFLRSVFVDKCVFNNVGFDNEARFNHTKFEEIEFTNLKIIHQTKEREFSNTIWFEGIKIGKSLVFSKPISLSTKDKMETNSDIEYGTIHVKNIILENVNTGDKAFFFIDGVKCDNLNISDLKSNATNIKFTDIEILKLLNIQNTMFDKTEFNGLNLRNAEIIMLNNVSFIGSHLTKIHWGKIDDRRFLSNINDKKPLDRQMARQLKAINDTQGEIVFANGFYSLEMRLHAKEMKWRKNLGEKIVQNIHGLVSNHGSSLTLATMWFFVFGFLFVVLAKDIIPITLVIFVFGSILMAILFADKIAMEYYKRIAVTILVISVFFYSESFASSEFFVALINPLNFKDSKDFLKDTNLLLVYSCRLIEVFIGYQIITVIRKNTKRK
jgi:uncharacterized protein YjbI with pentapeptide repeats